MRTKILFENPTQKMSERMKRIKSSGSKIEREMESFLKKLNVSYQKQPKLLGRPDFRIRGTKVLIFCDSAFWYGKKEKETKGTAFNKNKEFWMGKLNYNRKRDERNNRALRKLGWSVNRFSDDDVLKKREKTLRRLGRIVSNIKNKRPTAIDLFCGGGGLTLGLKKAGFEVLAGVELNSKITKTYAANHKEVKLFEKDVRNLTGKEILEKIGVDKVDLIAGCPPCQGFSSLTSKYKREDPRNDLAIEMARIVEEIKPNMVMMENVPRIRFKGKPVLDDFISRIEKRGYVVNQGVLRMEDYGVPQARRRFVLLAGKGFKINLPEQTHSRRSDEKNKLKPWLTLRDAIGKMKAPVTLSEANRKGNPKIFNWHVIRDLKEISIKRLKAMKAGESRRSLPKKLRPKCHSKSNKGFTNVYGRLSWNQVPPTITSGCTSPCMGRFGHPDETRTISVREAALIQTFPKNYVFDTEHIAVACDLLGNALPPKFAEKAAKACLNSFLKVEKH